MADKYHINLQGEAGLCKALKTCPFGSDDKHYSSAEEARSAFEAEMSSSSVFKKLSKKGFSDSTRNARQLGGTVYDQLVQQFGLASVEKDMAEKTDLRGVSLTYINQAVGKPIIGIAYGGDFRSEEEYGTSEIYKALEKGKNQKDLFYRKTDDAGNVGYVVVNPQKQDYRPEEILQREWDEALRRHNQPPYGNYTREIDKLEFRLTTKQLRERAKAAGIKPLPPTKQKLAQAIYRAEHSDEIIPTTQSVGEFHDGRNLIIMTDNPRMLATLDKLVEAAEHDSLRMGSSSNPFSRGAMFYDERDFSVATRNTLARAEKWEAQQMKKIEGLRERLQGDRGSRGWNTNSVYALGRPQAGFDSVIRYSAGKDGRKVTDPADTYYFINMSRQGHKQVSGWYNREELEAFASGDWTLADAEEQAYEAKYNRRK